MSFNLQYSSTEIKTILNWSKEDIAAGLTKQGISAETVAKVDCSTGISLLELNLRKLEACKIPLFEQDQVMRAINKLQVFLSLTSSYFMAYIQFFSIEEEQT